MNNAASSARFRAACGFAVVTAIAVACTRGSVAKTLEIYFIDVEGGQSTLIVTPFGETLLVDAGFPSSGTFQSRPGDPRDARDARRIAAAAKDARVSQIDYLLVTHFHADHVGGVVELSQLMPIRTFVDHGSVLPEADPRVPGTLAIFNAYAAVRAKSRHLDPKPGDRVPLKGIDVITVSSAGSTLVEPLAGAGRQNPACTTPKHSAEEPYENPRSTGVLVQFGTFRFLDVGDLTGGPLHALACPNDLVGPVDVYLVAHHGNADAADAATFAAFKPRVAVLNNGAKKGGAPEIFSMLRHVQGLEDTWQLHRSEKAGAENFADDRIANLDERTAHWIKLSATDGGSFNVTNGRTLVEKRYRRRQ